MLSRCLLGTSSHCLSTKEVLEIQVKSSQLHGHISVAFQSHNISGIHEEGFMGHHLKGFSPLFRKTHGFSGLDVNICVVILQNDEL